MMIYIAGMRDLSLIDYPRHPCIVIWFQGCNFRCQYCYNYELWEWKAENMMKIDELMRRLEEASRWEIGLKFGIDTNGINPKSIQQLASKRLLNHVAIDLKAPLNVEDYSKLTNINVTESDIENIRKSIKLALEEDSIENVEIRIPIVRGFNDDPSKTIEMKKDLIDIGYLKAIEEGRDVSIELLEVMHEVAANKNLRLQKNLTVEEIVKFGELLNLPKIYIRHRSLGLRESLANAKRMIKV
jgi:pyruvate formate lyase activating enzyme